MYWYVLSTYFFCIFLYQLFFISKGYIPGTCWLWWSTYFWFPDSIVRPPGSPAGCLQAIQAPAHALNQVTLKHLQVFHCCLAAPLTVPKCLGAGAGGLLGDSAVAGQLHPIHRLHDQLSAHQQTPAPASNAVSAVNGRVKDLGFKLGRPWWAAEYLSNPAKFKFRDFIREIKQRANLAWSWQRRWWQGRRPWAVTRIWSKILLWDIQAVLQSS